MAPPRQVAAPPKGSISVGWLWVSFLNWMSQVSVLPSMVTGASMEQALISSLSSKSGTRPCFPQVLGADGGHVHQGNRLVPARVQLLPQGEVILQGLLHGLAEGALLHVNFVQAGEEGGVAAVVAPIGVNHPQLGDGGIPVLLVPEVIPAELQVGRGSWQSPWSRSTPASGPCPRW